MEIIAHRGASANAPEHTWAAYDLALAQGADTLEIDLRLTADRRLAAVHDSTLWRTARDPRSVASLTRADIKALPQEQRPLRLSRILERYAGRVRFLLDLKDPAPPMERRVAALLEATGADAVVQSLDERSLRRVRRLAPGVPVAPLYERRPSSAALDRAAAQGFAGIGVRQQDVTANLVAGAARRGLDLRAWTVNDPLRAVALAELGVDGLITDRPGVVGMALAAAAAHPLAA